MNVEAAGKNDIIDPDVSPGDAALIAELNAAIAEGDVVFDWSTSVAPGTALSKADLEQMNVGGFQVNQIIAESADSFTVVPSTSGHEGAKVNLALDEPAREAVLSYTAEFSEATDFKMGGKLLGFNMGDHAFGGDNPENGGSVRVMWREDGQLAVYSYYNDKTGDFGEYVDTGIFIEPGESFDIDLKVTSNDAGESNGGFELYVNGELAAEQSGMQFTNNGAPIEEVLNHVFWGGAGPEWEADAGSAVTISDLEARAL